MSAIYAIYGASGCGRGVLPVARDMQASGRLQGGAELVFVDDREAGRQVNGQRVLGYEQFRDDPRPEKKVCIAVADGTTRARLAGRCAADGIDFFQVQAANVVVMDDCTIGEGAILCPFVTLTSNIRIGRHFQANLYGYVEHDCVIGDFVTFAPGVHCNGNVTVEDHAYIGTGAVIKQGKPGEPLVIGRGAVVGMGAVVTKNVPAGATVVGNPARIMNKD